MIVLYMVIAVFMECLYVAIAAKVFEFLTGYLVLRKGGIRLPVKPLMVYLTVALVLFSLFHILVIIFALVVLE